MPSWSPVKRSQHLNATDCARKMLRAFGRPIAMCCDMLGDDGSNFIICQIWANKTQHVPPNNVAMCSAEILRSFGRGFKFEKRSNLLQQHPTCHNTSQQVSQTRATCCAQQCIHYMLRWNIAIVWPELINIAFASLVWNVLWKWTASGCLNSNTLTSFTSMRIRKWQLYWVSAFSSNLVWMAKTPQKRRCGHEAFGGFWTEKASFLKRISVDWASSSPFLLE